LGLDPAALHDRFWAARGVFVVRPGEAVALSSDAQLYMLTDSRTLAVFPLGKAADRLYWNRPDVLFIRLRGRASAAYREVAREAEDGRFLRFERQYGIAPTPTARIALTCDRRVAELWRSTDGSARMWRAFRRQTRQVRRETLVVDGRCYDRDSDHDLDALATDLVSRWRTPSMTIEGATELRSGVWGSGAGARVPSDVRIVGRAWIGAGREIGHERSVVGPAVLWDDPAARPPPPALRWDNLEPTGVRPAAGPAQARRHPRRCSAGQRAFDIVFSIATLLLTLPLFPLAMLAIWLEDGRPFFFGHRRETVGGREFPCLKFRTMRRDADQIKAQLAASNRSDGPQFFIENDPRVTVVGRWLRRTNLRRATTVHQRAASATCPSSVRGRVRAAKTSAAPRGVRPG
jgi:hypothetical protein